MVVDTKTGVNAQKLNFDTWGKITEDSNPGFQPFAFAGGIYDLDTGLVRFGARDYNPSIGRWLSKDPIRFDGGWNFYVYVGNDPVNKIDPLGLYEQETFVNDLIQRADIEWQSMVSTLGKFTGAYGVAGTCILAPPVAAEAFGSCIANPALCSTVMETIGSGLLYGSSHTPSAPSLKPPLIEALSRFSKYVGGILGDQIE